MLLFISTHKLLTGVIWGLLLSSIGAQIWIGVRLQKLLDELDKPTPPKHPFLKKCRVHPQKINLKEHVDHCLDAYRIGPFSVMGLKTLSAQGIMLSVIFCGAGVCIGIVRGETIGSLLPFYVFSMIGLYCYYAVSGVVDANARMDKLRLKLYAYLERQGKVVQQGPDKEEAGGRPQAAEVKEDDEMLELMELFEELLI